MNKNIEKIGNIFDYKKGYAFKSSDYKESGTPIIRVTDFTQDSISDLKNIYIDSDSADSYKSYELLENDIIIQTVGSWANNINSVVGKVIRVPRKFNKSLLNQNAVRLRVKEGYSQDYLYYLLKSDMFFKYIINHAQGAANQASITLDSIFKFAYPIPDLPIQNKIAGILSAYDELIENNKKRIALLEAMAEELYKEWFVRFRFPNYENTEFEKAVPKDWLERPTSELFEILGGGTPSKDEEEYWKDGEINWFTPSDLTKGSSLFIENSELKCNETGLSKSSAKLFPAFSIMMTSRATIGVLSINTTEACTNQGFITCLPNEQFPLTYLYFWLKFSKPYFDILANGATFAELSRGVFKKIKMRVPTQDLIDKFDNFCKPVFDEILNIQRQTENLTIQKNQLLPRLISGKLSVEHLNIQQPPTPAQPTDNE